MPPLFWVTVTNASKVAGIAEFGVVFLLFLIGLEMTFERLASMRRAILTLGGAQWLLGSLALGGVLHFLGLEPAAAVVLAGCLA